MEGSEFFNMQRNNFTRKLTRGPNLAIKRLQWAAVTLNNYNNKLKVLFET